MEKSDSLLLYERAIADQLAFHVKRADPQVRDRLNRFYSMLRMVEHAFYLRRYRIHRECSLARMDPNSLFRNQVTAVYDAVHVVHDQVDFLEESWLEMKYGFLPTGVPMDRRLRDVDRALKALVNPTQTMLEVLRSSRQVDEIQHFDLENLYRPDAVFHDLVPLLEAFLQQAYSLHLAVNRPLRLYEEVDI